MGLWRRCILLLISSENFMSITAETGHTLPQSCEAFKLGNKCWCSEQSTGAEAAAVGTQGTFWSLFHMGTPGSNLQQTEPQVSTRATSARRSLISINDRSKSQGLQVQPRFPWVPARASSGGQALCKGIFFFQSREGSTHDAVIWLASGLTFT